MNELLSGGKKLVVEIPGSFLKEHPDWDEKLASYYALADKVALSLKSRKIGYRLFIVAFIVYIMICFFWK